MVPPSAGKSACLNLASSALCAVPLGALAGLLTAQLAAEVAPEADRPPTRAGKADSSFAGPVRWLVGGTAWAHEGLGVRAGMGVARGGWRDRGVGDGAGGLTSWDAGPSVGAASSSLDTACKELTLSLVRTPAGTVHGMC